jgi:hypothetical protein
MTAPWTNDSPISLQQFTAAFPDDAACAAYLQRKLWPNGFVCPKCGSARSRKMETRPWTFECRDCLRQTSVTARTIMHGSHVPLRTWFLAAHVVATHTSGISAVALQEEAGIESYEIAWLLLKRLQKAMAGSKRSFLDSVTEVDHASIPYRSKNSRG